MAQSTLDYDLLKDFQPLSLVSTESTVIVGRKSIPPNNLREFIAWLKANPDKGSAGTSGPGQRRPCVGVFFQKETGTQFQFVPYRGVALAMQDMVAGQIDFMFDLSANSLPQVAREISRLMRLRHQHAAGRAGHPDRG